MKLTGKNALWREFAGFDEGSLMFNGQPVPLGGMSVQTFLSEYWHKKPLLIRNAIPNFRAFFTPQDVMNAMLDEHIETRLIHQHTEKGWQLNFGPFKKKQIPKLNQSNWTALVQGVDVVDARGYALLNLFRFIPDARLDDLMVSLATDGGGVGPHYDSYDVFLLQAHGQRHWSIAQEQDLSIVPDIPVKILQHFNPTESFVLNPGDMLYLPPQYAHDGVAVGECMTYSIGFRAPTYQDIGQSLLSFVADNVELDGRYEDAHLQYQTTPAQLPNDMVDDVYEHLQSLKWDKSWVAECLGCYLTEPKPTVWLECEKSLSFKEFKKKCLGEYVVLAAGSRMLYHSPWIFINGEHLVAEGQDEQDLKQLADSKQLKMSDKISHDCWQLLHNWYEQGWLKIAE